MSVSLIHLILNKLLVSMVIVLMETIATIVNVLLTLLELTAINLVKISNSMQYCNLCDCFCLPMQELFFNVNLMEVSEKFNFTKTLVLLYQLAIRCIIKSYFVVMII